VILILFGAVCVEHPSPVAAQAAVERVERRLMPTILIQGEPVPAYGLEDRMAFFHVPAVSVAVMNGGEIEWVRAWGLADVESGRPATPRTLFQAASISKPVAATAALTLVQEGRLDLDADVNHYLTSWQVPATEHMHGQAVTLRRILTHTAGLTVHGFPGYTRGTTMPSTIGVLDGLGNTAPIRVDTTPGAINRYSGGGYTVMQLLLSDVTERPFAQVMDERVLSPLGMTLSTYEQPLPPSRWGEAASAYRSDGTPVEEQWHVYPEQAAAGLWTTPTELARWGLGILAAYDGAEGGALSPDMARRMLDPGQYGQGLGPGVARNRLSFGHGGANEGFRCGLVVFFDGRGAAVMTNGDNGNILAAEIFATLADEYDWPSHRAETRNMVVLEESRYDALAGRYAVKDADSTITVEIVREDGRLRLHAPGVPRFELLPASETSWFTRETGTRLTVEWEDGQVIAFRMYGFRAVRARE
jgi:CubicO group peptidase (beta-lactamase class C family)